MEQLAEEALRTKVINLVIAHFSGKENVSAAAFAEYFETIYNLIKHGKKENLS